jgi:hypothetical protein
VPTISVTIQVPWPKAKPTFSELERTIHRAVTSAGRQALVQALGAWERELLPTAGARQRRVRRYLLTRLGPIRIWRWKTRQDGRYGFPLDRAIGLAPWQTCSPFVWERACSLAAAHPYRTAARLLSDLVGCATDHRVLWRLVQKAGRLRRAELEGDRAAMFELGEAPPEPTEPPEMVVTEIDGAVLRRQRGGVFEAKVAAAYRGKAVVSATARHPRRVVTGKVVVAGVYEQGTAGQVIYSALCRSVGLHRARHKMVAGDGAEWIPVLVREWFPDHAFQLDHYHLKQRLRHTAVGDPKRAGRWISWALAGQWSRIERSMVHLVARGALDPKIARDTRAFLELNAPAVWAFRALLQAGAPPELCTRGSGVVEHTIDLLVARRMKHQGMRWSKEGAHNILVLRALMLDAAAWRAWWKEVAA